VEVKKTAGVQCCCHAFAHAATFTGKPWRWVLIIHDAIVENMTLEVLVGQFVVN
jgi:type III restriction enzyme